MLTCIKEFVHLSAHLKRIEGDTKTPNSHKAQLPFESKRIVSTSESMIAELKTNKTDQLSWKTASKDSAQERFKIKNRRVFRLDNKNKDGRGNQNANNCGKNWTKNLFRANKARPLTGLHCELCRQRNT